MSPLTVRAVRAYLPDAGGGADYHDQPAGHWIDDHIASPMAKYAEYRASRQSFGLHLLGTVVVEVEASDGTVGFAPTTGGEPAAWIVENHLAKLVEGAPVTELERIWDRMFLSTLHYGRKGLALNAISGVDLALWDLAGKLRGEPVHALLGGAVRDELVFYATGPRPDVARDLGFIGGKVPLRHGPAEGEAGIARTVAALAQLRDAVGPEFWLMLDCWMSLDVRHAARLAHALDAVGLRWLEEPLLPDDYWGHAALRKRLPAGMLLSSGEHEATRYGFRLLLELGAVDILQPDVGWCGGLTELLKISALADAHGALVVPHGSSVYSYHFVATRHNSPFAEFLMMHPDGTEVVPMFRPLLLDEPVPRGGRLAVSELDRPGFGVRLDPSCELRRPYRRPSP
ncbi:L-rhamnonate dehydratase [Jiangella alkaliphila]|uniref:L-rhamnonate dehydratase n=1 Tax=Jiangella alkaliphila TaxID=419479 RepID=A0A1H2JSU0_9ACTN|nr:L-rhamnonate dehydratase [Jiangella alkaliphila]SDU59241.1 L-rhamnonate dehydratase [Jiangella alkaliphila]